MTEQKACTLCGAGGHTAAQCNWNKALELLREIRPSIPRDVLELWCKDRDVFLASQQVEQCEHSDHVRSDGICIECGEKVRDKHPEQAECAQGEREAFEAWTDRKYSWVAQEPEHNTLSSWNGYAYENRVVQGMWEAWQARAALAQPSLVRTGKELFDALNPEHKWHKAPEDLKARYAAVAVAQHSPAPELCCERCGGDCSAANPPIVDCPKHGGVQQALDHIDDFIARCNGDDRGSSGSVNVLREALTQHDRIAGALQQQKSQWVSRAEELGERLDAAQSRLAELLAALERAAHAMWNSEANMDNEAAAAEEAIGNAKSGAPVAQAGQVPESFRLLLKHAHGMTTGVDWNKGTAAGHHREPLGEAVVQCQAWLAAAPQPAKGDASHE
jgi:hypothetical protein